MSLPPSLFELRRMLIRATLAEGTACSPHERSDMRGRARDNPGCRFRLRSSSYGGCSSGLRLLRAQHVARMSAAICGAACEVTPDVASAFALRATADAHPGYAC